MADEEQYLDLAEYFVDIRGHDDRLGWELANLDQIPGHEFDSDD